MKTSSSKPDVTLSEPGAGEGSFGPCPARGGVCMANAQGKRTGSLSRTYFFSPSFLP